MEIVGTGIDIVECERIKQMMDTHGDKFLHRVYTDCELSYCRSRRRAVEHFAGRWAAKEAVVKALGTGWNRSIGYKDIEVQNASDGVPKIGLRGAAREQAQQLGITRIFISISHCEAYATAHAVAVTAPSK